MSCRNPQYFYIEAVMDFMNYYFINYIRRWFQYYITFIVIVEYNVMKYCTMFVYLSKYDDKDQEGRITRTYKRTEKL